MRLTPRIACAIVVSVLASVPVTAQQPRTAPRGNDGRTFATSDKAGGTSNDNRNRAPAYQQVALQLQDGTAVLFNYEDSHVLPPMLAAKYAKIVRTYRGRGVDRPELSARFEVINGQINYHVSFDDAPGALLAIGSRDQRQNPARLLERSVPSCKTRMKSVTDAPTLPRVAWSKWEPRTYRLAIACTGEFGQQNGGTPEKILPWIATVVNRLNGIYERDLGVTFQLIEETESLLATDASKDGFTDGDTGKMLDEIESKLAEPQFKDKFDVGHLLALSGGGSADEGAGQDGIKARGVTGYGGNVLARDYITDFLAHEIGHQFGATHTYNGQFGSCWKAHWLPASACEPGSGSTVMAYASVGGADSLQSQNDEFFHAISLQFMANYITVKIPNVGQKTGVVNAPPQVTTDAEHWIPRGTPFHLEAIGMDPDGDRLTYCWEQVDPSPKQVPLASCDDGACPLFRSFPPTIDNFRWFPQYGSAEGRSLMRGEQLPTTDRTLTFRVTVRDNHLGPGKIADAETIVHILGKAEPFWVDQPPEEVFLSKKMTVTWHGAEVDPQKGGASKLRIWLVIPGSADQLLADNTPNDLSEEVTLPAVDTTEARIRIDSPDNIFFATNPRSFWIKSK